MFKFSQVVVRLLLIVVAVLHGAISFSQEPVTTGGMDGVMRSNDKIYVVMAICLTILIGLIIYAIRIDRKIKKIEDGIK